MNAIALNLIRLASLSLLASGACGQAETQPSKKDLAPPLSSVRRGSEVMIARGGPSFQIPREWVEWHEEFGHSIYLEPSKMVEKDGDGDGAGEWDREYGELTDALFDLRDCGFQGGDDGWGTHGVSFADLTMRLYVLKDEVAVVEKRLDREGATALRKIMSPARAAERNAAGLGVRPPKPQEGEARGKPAKESELPPLLGFKPKREVQKPWRRSVYAFDLFFGDYGATAHVDVRLRRFGGRTVAAVFFYTDYQAQEPLIGRISKSLRWDDPPAPERKQGVGEEKKPDKKG